MPRWSLRRRLDTSNLRFNCDDLLSVQRHSSGGTLDSALNSNVARQTLPGSSLRNTVAGKLLSLPRVGFKWVTKETRTSAGIRCQLLPREDKDKLVNRLLLASIFAL